MRLGICMFSLLSWQIFTNKSEAGDQIGQSTRLNYRVENRVENGLENSLQNPRPTSLQTNGQAGLQTAQINQEQEIKTMTEKANEEGKMEILPCGNKPNCVSTAGPESHKIPRWILVGKFSDIKDFIKNQASEVLTDEENFLHVVYKSRIFRFSDDVIFKNVNGTISMRSSSRVGYSDMGVNGKRMQKLASELKEKNLIAIEE